MSWRRLLLLDVVLVAALIYGFVRVRQSWMNFDSTHRVDAVRAEKDPVRNFPAIASLNGTVEDWTEISTKDPFSFDRNDVPIVAPKLASPTQPKPILFGTMAIGNDWIAMLAPGQGGNRVSQSVKVGQSVGDWQVVEIRDKSVVVSGENGVRQTIDIAEATAQGRTYERTGSSCTFRASCDCRYSYCVSTADGTSQWSSGVANSCSDSGVCRATEAQDPDYTIWAHY